MKTEEEIRDWLLANAVNEEGNLVLDFLDFSNFDGDVSISYMTVKKGLWQRGHDVKGSLFQGGHTVGRHLRQDQQNVGEILFQDEQIVGGDLWQINQKKVVGSIK